MFGIKSLLAVMLVTAAVILNSCYYDNEEELYGNQQPCDTTNISYSADIAPLMIASCNGCHSGAGAAAGIATNSYDQVVANIERISGAINHKPGFSAMPQNGSKLSDCDLNKFTAWINSGNPNN